MQDGSLHGKTIRTRVTDLLGVQFPIIQGGMQCVLGTDNFPERLPLIARGAFLATGTLINRKKC